MTKLDNLIPAATTQAVASAGLHKIAGAMLGYDELTLKEAVFTLGAKAYMRRKEARAIVDGIASYGALVNEKVAENPAIMALLRRAAMPALAGAGVGALGGAVADDDDRLGGALKGALTGGALGGIGGAIGGHTVPTPIPAENGPRQSMSSADMNSYLHNRIRQG
jgi:hypothetical protein